MKPNEWYAQRAKMTENKLSKVQKLILHVSVLRVFLFVMCITVCILLWKEDIWWIMLGLGVFFVPFLWLIKVHNRMYYRKEWLELQLDILQGELKALDNDYSGREEGKEFICPEHPYSYDLDVFGSHSLFQAINRTCTHIGKKTLATWLQIPLTCKEEIEERQRAVRDTSQRKEFREEFQITGLISHNQQTDTEEIRKWSEQTLEWSQKRWVKAGVWIVPTINLILLIMGIAGYLSLSWLGFSFSVFVIASFGIVQKATHIQAEYGNKLKTLRCYAKLIARCQKEQWEAPYIKELIKRLEIDGESPVKALDKLSRELDRLDLRNNQLLYIILEGSIFFQLRQIIRIEQWKAIYGKYLMKWMETVGEIDALCAMGNFAYNHPDYTFPHITEEPFCFYATQMGHPLMNASKCVKNDAEIPSQPFFLIITGANMAGKSTYLRTIGINYLLACIGCPACCKSLSVYPAQLITSLRTTDSLTDNESYFFAELKRLKRIIDLLNEGKQLFIILDEILKGTNSADKQKGSFDLIQQFIRLKGNGIIATHDLLLGTLIEKYPEHIRNYCFEADITNDELTFSYKLHQGIAQNMNACFLMKKMGITLQ